MPETFTPDNIKLYFLTDDGREFTYLRSYDMQTAEQADVEKADWDIIYTYFSPKGTYRASGINKDARTEIRIYETASGDAVSLPVMPSGDISSVKFSEDEQQLAFYVNSSRSPNNLFVYNFSDKEPRQLTNTMNPAIATDELVEGKVLRYKSFDDLEIPALLYTPKGIKESEKCLLF